MPKKQINNPVKPIVCYPLESKGIGLVEIEVPNNEGYKPEIKEISFNIKDKSERICFNYMESVVEQAYATGNEQLLQEKTLEIMDRFEKETIREAEAHLGQSTNHHNFERKNQKQTDEFAIRHYVEEKTTPLTLTRAFASEFGKDFSAYAKRHEQEKQERAAEMEARTKGEAVAMA